MSNDGGESSGVTLPRRDPGRRDARWVAHTKHASMVDDVVEWGGWGSNPRPGDYETASGPILGNMQHKTPGQTTIDMVGVWRVAGLRPTASHGSGPTWACQRPGSRWCSRNTFGPKPVAGG
jgi:hypothetical protein